VNGDVACSKSTLPENGTEPAAPVGVMSLIAYPLP
jgi:hypothetical protein